MRKPRGKIIESHMCGTVGCAKEVMEGIACDVCAKWYHPKCSKISAKALKLYQEHSCLKWVCTECVKVCRAHSRRDTEGGVSTSPKAAPGAERNRARNKATRVETVVIQDNPDSVGDLRALLNQQAKELASVKERTKTIEWQLSKLHKESDLALGRHRNVVIKGIPEPICPTTKVREREVRHHLTTILRMAELPGDSKVRRAFRLGKWKNPEAGKAIAPRPVLIDFANPRTRDTLLAAAGRVEKLSKGKFRIEPDMPPKRVSPPGGTSPIGTPTSFRKGSEPTVNSSRLGTPLRAASPDGLSYSTPIGKSPPKPTTTKKGKGTRN